MPIGTSVIKLFASRVFNLISEPAMTPLLVRLAATACLLLPLGASAQSGGFLTRLGNDTIAIERYEEVGSWLADHGGYGWRVYPQGSFRLGTVVRGLVVAGRSVPDAFNRVIVLEGGT